MNEKEMNDPMMVLNRLSADIHSANVKAGWWDEYDQLDRYLPDDLLESVRANILGTKIALIHSEGSEMLEGLRKNVMDDHLPNRTMEEVEAADLFIRLLDYCGKRQLDIGGAIREKLAYNQRRADHKAEARQQQGGKKF